MEEGVGSRSRKPLVIPSSVRKQRGMNGGSQLACSFSFFIQPCSSACVTVQPSLVSSSSLTVILSRNTATELPTAAFPRWLSSQSTRNGHKDKASVTSNSKMVHGIRKCGRWTEEREKCVRVLLFTFGDCNKLQLPTHIRWSEWCWRLRVQAWQPHWERASASHRQPFPAHRHTRAVFNSVLFNDTLYRYPFTVTSFQPGKLCVFSKAHSGSVKVKGVGGIGWVCLISKSNLILLAKKQTFFKQIILAVNSL